MARLWMVAFVLGVACGPPPQDTPDANAGIDSSGPDGNGPSSGSYVLYETFNAMTTGAAPTTGWETDGSVIVREVPFAADKSVEIQKPAGVGLSRLATTFPDQHGRVVFEAKVLARETAGFKAIPYIYDSAGTAVASVSFQDGSIQAHAGATIVTVQPFVANVWYRVRVVVDTTAGTFDLFVDGVRKLVKQPLRMAAPAVARVSYYLDGANAGTLVVDNVMVYTERGYIGTAPQPAFDPRDYGAIGDGVTNDQVAIQQAIDAAAGTGGSVVLANGVYLSGTLTIASTMTFFIEPSAILRGSTNVADYPALAPATGNTQLLNCQRALLYVPAASHVTLDGGGTIDGQGDAFTGAEGTRPMVIWSVLSDHVTIQNLYLMKGAVSRSARRAATARGAAS